MNCHSLFTLTYSSTGWKELEYNRI